MQEKQQDEADLVAQDNNNEIVQKVVKTPELLEQVLGTPEASGVISLLVQQQVSHSGPLPMAQEIQKYNEVIPNGADRIMRLAENEQKNRYSIPKWSLFIRGLGLVFAMISVALVVFFCFSLMEKGQYGLSVTVMISVLVALAGVFAVGKIVTPHTDKNTNEE